MSLQYLVDDVYKMLDTLEAGTSVPISDKAFEDFGKACAKALKRQMQPKVTPSKGRVRMSNLGRPDRILYYEVNNPDKKELCSASNRIRFMYGDLVEELVLFLMEASGNTIENKQQHIKLTVGSGEHEATLNGGCDGTSRGTVFDIKSASSYAFNNKFKPGGLEASDPFGYRTQLAAYMTDNSVHTGSGTPGFIVIDKTSGEMKECSPALPAAYEVRERYEHVLLVTESDIEPPRCHPPEPKGNKGNMILGKECSWCDFKQHCYRDANNGRGLRSFQYKSYKGLEDVYFTEVWDEPRVKETTDDTNPK